MQAGKLELHARNKYSVHYNFGTIDAFHDCNTTKQGRSENICEVESWTTHLQTFLTYGFEQNEGILATISGNENVRSFDAVA